MKPGPKTQPTKLKIVKGNPGRRPLPKDESQPDIPEKIPKPPKYLDRVGKKEWKSIAAHLHPLGLLTEMDLTALAAYCSNYSIWIDAMSKVKVFGLLNKAQSGFPMQSPWLAIQNKAMVEMRKWLTEFGMTPSSRTGIKVKTKGKGKGKDQGAKRFFK